MAASRDFLLVTAARILTALIGIATIRIATTMLAPAQYGELSIFVAIQSLCGLFLVNPVGQHINRHTHQWWDDGTMLTRLSSYRRYIFAIAMIGTTIVYCIVAQPTAAQALFAALTMFAMLNAATWNLTSISILNMLGFRVSALAWGVLTAILASLASLIFVSLQHSATAWFCGQAVGMALGALGSGRSLRKFAAHTSRIDHTVALLDRETIIGYCLPLAVATGLMWLQLSGYRFVIRAYWGVEVLGYAAVGLLLAGQVWSIAETLAQQYLYPLFYRRISQADPFATQLAMSDLLNFLGPLYLILASATFLAAPYILKSLASSSYEGAEIFVRYGIAIECCRVLSNLLSNAAQATKKPRSMALPYAVGAIASIAPMVVVGVLGLSIYWAGTVLLLAAGVTLLAMGFAMHQQVAFKLDLKRWAVALGILIPSFVPAFWLAYPKTWQQTVCVLIIIILAGGIIVWQMIWKNAALGRFVAAKLH